MIFVYKVSTSLLIPSAMFAAVVAVRTLSTRQLIDQLWVLGKQRRREEASLSIVVLVDGRRTEERRVSIKDVLR